MEELLKESFGDWGEVYSLNDFMEVIKRGLREKNFNKGNSRLVFCTCSDDINRLEGVETIENALTREYNRPFYLGGLGAYPIGGISGIIAASHHPPDNLTAADTRHGNLIFFISPHMGLIRNNAYYYGKIIRPGQERTTFACSVMMGFLAQLMKAGSVKWFKILPDELELDPTRVILHQELIAKYSNELDEILMLKDKNQQVSTLFKLNYKVVKNKFDQIFAEFLEKERTQFQGDIAIVGGITVNTRDEYFLYPGKDYFILKEITYPLKG